MCAYFLKCVIAVGVVVLGVKAEVIVENKGYKHILVSFSPTVATEDGRQLVEEMKNVLKETSDILSKAVGLKISQVTFLIPSAWDTSEWENMTIQNVGETTAASTADILVDGTTDSAFGKRPFALQYGGCAVPGSRITVPTQFLKEESSFPKGKLVAREWLKYRYGVFDENGFPGDKMYPVYHKVPGSQSSDVEISDCTNNPLQYNFRDVKGNECTLKVDEQTGLPVNEIDGCFIYPDEQSAQNVTSSLMYFKNELPNLEQICGKEEYQHNKLASNKQNILCQGKSVWEILQKSPDFAISSESNFADDEGEMEFLFVQEAKPRVVIAWENTGKLRKKKEAITKVIGKSLYDLPDGSKYGLYPFKDEKNDQINLKELNDWPKNRDISLASDFASPLTACTDCAISKAIDAFVQNSAAEDALQETGSIVIFTATDPGDNQELLEKVKSSQLCLIVFAFTDQGATFEGFEALVSASSCGSFWNASSDLEDNIIFEKMFSALELVLPSSTDLAVTKTVKTDYLQFGTDTIIPVDSTVANVTLWIIGVVERENIQCKTKDETIEMNSVFESTAFTALYYNPKKNEELSCSFKYDTIDKALTQVRVTSKRGEYFETKVWIKDTTDKEDHQMPVIIYANVNFGPYPVKNAEVKAFVSLPDEGNEQELELYDDGRGDPDITAGDGTYSRYFIGFTSEGTYTVKVVVTDNGGQAKASKNALQQCCGSSIYSSDDLDLDAFHEDLDATFEAKSKKPETGYKPSRITDLRIVSSNASSIVLEWTSPGGEADIGKASSYEIKVFCDEECTEGDIQQWIKSIDKPLPILYGSTQQATVIFRNILTKKKTLFLGIEAENDMKQKSYLSNIVYIVRSQDTEQEITTPGSKIKDKTPKYSSAGIIIGCSITAIFVVICIIIGAYFWRKRSKPSENQDLKEITNDDSKQRLENLQSPREIKNIENGSKIRRVESFPVLLYTHDQIKDFKRKNKDPPLYKADIAPKPWMSLDMLPRSKSNVYNKSMGSSSTIHVSDQEASSSNEMKQIDDISHNLDIQCEKIAKF